MVQDKEMTKTEGTALRQVDERRTVTPVVDVFENKDEFLLVADLPGVASNQLEIDVVDGELTLRGRRSYETPEGGELDYDYWRKFVVPDGIGVDKIAAELKNGELRIHLPKAEDTKPRRIAVTRG